MARYVVPDTCALAAALFNEKYAANADPLLEAIKTGKVDAIAPSSGIIEFLNVCRKKTEGYQGGVKLSAEDVEGTLYDFLTLQVMWIETDESLAENAWALYRNHKIGTADALFLETARRWEAELWTTDAPFFEEASKVYGNVRNLQTVAFI